MTRAFDTRLVPARFTHLKAMAKSPAHYLHAVQQGRPDNKAMRIGRMVHGEILGRLPDDEDGELVVYEGERRGNAWKDFAAAHVDDEVVTRDEYDSVDPIVAAVRADPVATQFLGTRDGHEQRIAWRANGRAMTSRPDIIGRASFGHFVADLKTTSDASPFTFQRLAFRMSYHAQLALYSDAVSTGLGLDVQECYVIAVEVGAPYAVTVHRMTRALLEEGRRAYLAWIERLLVCESNDEWPSYAQACVPWDVPPWLQDRDDGTDDEDEASA